MASGKRRTRQEWEAILADWRASGLSRRAYCRSKELSVSTFRFRQRKLAGSGEQPSTGLVEVGRLALRAPGERLVVRCAGIEVELSGTESEAFLSRLFRALRVS